MTDGTIRVGSSAERFVADVGRVTGQMQFRNAVFVFGSNLAGVHGAGAARVAAERYGAARGVGVGLRGHSYAIPTKDHRIQTLPLDQIARHVADFLAVAAANPERPFVVTRIGCGLAGYDDHEIAPMFAGAPVNCLLPDGWRSEVSP